jgi:hypothetical protein
MGEHVDDDVALPEVKRGAGGPASATSRPTVLGLRFMR